MPREKEPLKRCKGKKEVIMKIHDIWRNEDVQKDVIKNIKKFK